jgi:hypothetical protein
MIKKSRKNEEPKQRSTKEILQEWLQMNPKETPKPKTNEEMIVKGMIESAKNGDSRSFQTINSIINGTESGETPSLQIQVVNNTRLEKFLYMTDEQFEEWEKEHEGQKEYKITCLSPEARMKLDEE